MPKHKKTREEKKVADMRNQQTPAVQQIHTHPTYIFSAKNVSSHVKKVETGSVLTFVKRDLQKTALISLVIITLQLLFYFLLHNHMLAINFVRY